MDFIPSSKTKCLTLLLRLIIGWGKLNETIIYNKVSADIWSGQMSSFFLALSKHFFDKDGSALPKTLIMGLYAYGNCDSECMQTMVLQVISLLFKQICMQLYFYSSLMHSYCWGCTFPINIWYHGPNKTTSGCACITL